MSIEKVKHINLTMSVEKPERHYTFYSKRGRHRIILCCIVNCEKNSPFDFQEVVDQRRAWKLDEY